MKNSKELTAIKEPSELTGSESNLYPFIPTAENNEVSTSLEGERTMPLLESTTFGHDVTENTDMISEFQYLPSVIKILTPVLEQLNKKMSIVADKYEKLADLNAH
ncbi:unnamed protein product [Rhizopus stolonifer]